MPVFTLLPRYRRLRTAVAVLAGCRPQAMPVAGLARDIRVQIASTRADWEESLRLVAARYQARGYEAPDAPDFRFTSHHALPDTVTLVAKEGARVVATMSLVFDNTLLGLPIEGLYPMEVRRLRQTGTRLAEAASLAARDLSTAEFPPVFLALIRLAMQYHARHAGNAWGWVITVNPRHRSFYTKLLGFVPLGPWRAYPAVRGHPAEAYCLDDRLMRARAPETHQQVFGEPLPRAALEGPRMPANLVRYFGSRSSQTDWRRVEKILQHVKKHGNLRRW